jgi:hypothetical protein
MLRSIPSEGVSYRLLFKTEMGLVIFTVLFGFLRLNLLKKDLDVFGVFVLEITEAGFTVSTGLTFLRVKRLKNDFFGAGAREGATFFLVKKLNRPPPLFLDLSVRAILI